MTTTISRDRFSNQRIVLSNGTVLTGKSVRRISRRRFQALGGGDEGVTLGDVRVNGREIPVIRLRGRGGWRQAGGGTSYDASPSFSLGTLRIW